MNEKMNDNRVVAITYYSINY